MAEVKLELLIYQMKADGKPKVCAYRHSVINVLPAALVYIPTFPYHATGYPVFVKTPR